MFENMSRPDSSFDEGVIVQVDPRRKTCKVKTITGQSLEQVQWTESVGNSSRGGDRVGPTMGDRVVLMYGLGYPLIFGFLPKPQSTGDAFPLHISTGQTLVDIEDFSPGGSTIIGDANKPGDLLNGDRTMSSGGGAFLGLLRAGGVLIRSSRMSEIFLSKLDDVIKVMSRNWEHYTDVSTDIVKNFRGRVYRYIGYTNNFTESKNEAYRYHQYFGDCAAAEAVKANYLSPPGSVPADAGVIFKEQVTDGSEKMHRTLTLAGEEEVVVTGAAFTRRVTTADTTTISFNDQNTITVNSPVIKLQRADGAVVTLDSTGIHLAYSGGNVDMNSTGIHNTFSGHFIHLTAAGVQLG